MICYLPLCFHCALGSFIHNVRIYRHNLIIFLIKISSMRLNEGIIQILSQMLAKNLQEGLILVLAVIFIEITRGPLLYAQF